MTVQRMVLDRFPEPKLARTLSPNGRAHWAQRAGARMRVVEHVWLALQTQGIRPIVGPARITLHYTFPTRVRHDPDNLMTGVVKAMIDVLVVRGILKDDSTREVTLTLAPPVVEKGERRLTVELEGETA